MPLSAGRAELSSPIESLKLNGTTGCGSVLSGFLDSVEEHDSSFSLTDITVD